MQTLYFSQGTMNDADGLTVSVAQFDDDGFFVAGPESKLTIAARESGNKVDAAQYGASFYLGKQITEDEFNEVFYGRGQTRGFVGVINGTGLAKREQDVALYNEGLAAMAAERALPLIEDTDFHAKARGKQQAEVDDLIVAKGVHKRAVAMVRADGEQGVIEKAAKARSDNPGYSIHSESV